MSDMRLIVVGAAGRMGRTLVNAVAEAEGAVLVGAIEREGSEFLGSDSGEVAGCGHLGVEIVDDPLPVFARADGVLDFTSPAATLAFSELAAQARIVHVIGTTGMSEEEIAKLEPASRHAVLVRSGNMSLGVNLLAALTKKVAAALDLAFDVEILEMHHRNKVDAPSGTALLLGEAAAEGRGVKLSDHSVMSREGHTGARKTGDIGFATLRGGSVVGEHSVIFAGPSERIVMSHSAEDRGIFARGAVKAALWGRGRKPGHYSMMDVLGLGD